MECINVLHTACVTPAYRSSSAGFRMMLACECSAHAGAW